MSSPPDPSTASTYVSRGPDTKHAFSHRIPSPCQFPRGLEVLGLPSRRGLDHVISQVDAVFPPEGQKAWPAHSVKAEGKSQLQKANACELQWRKWWQAAMRFQLPVKSLISQFCVGALNGSYPEGTPFSLPKPVSALGDEERIFKPQATWCLERVRVGVKVHVCWHPTTVSLGPAWPPVRGNP